MTWGHLEDEYSAKASEKLSDYALFFLMFIHLKWPCSITDLTKSWYKALLKSHPDRYPNDPNAKNRTQMINLGYQELLSKLQE